MSYPNYYIYIMSSASGTLYTGVSNNLQRRVLEHKSETIPGFSQKYHCTKLVYFEIFESINDAIAREKQIKKYRRDKKATLIKSINPGWRDSCQDLID